MSSRRQRSIRLGGRYRQVSLYKEPGRQRANLRGICVHGARLFIVGISCLNWRFPNSSTSKSCTVKNKYFVIKSSLYQASPLESSYCISSFADIWTSVLRQLLSNLTHGYVSNITDTCLNITLIMGILKSNGWFHLTKLAAKYEGMIDKILPPFVRGRSTPTNLHQVPKWNVWTNAHWK